MLSRYPLNPKGRKGPTAYTTHWVDAANPLIVTSS